MSNVKAMSEQARTGAPTVDGIDVEWLDADAVEILFKQYFAMWWASKRKAAPLNRLLARTRSWVERLPEDVRPVILMRRYPRIANHIAANWRDPSMLGPYLESLLVDRRGDREGFAADVVQELRALQSYSSRGAFRYGRSDVDPDVWGSDSSGRAYEWRDSVRVRTV